MLMLAEMIKACRSFYFLLLCQTWKAAYKMMRLFSLDLFCASCMKNIEDCVGPVSMLTQSDSFRSNLTQTQQLTLLKQAQSQCFTVRNLSPRDQQLPTVVPNHFRMMYPRSPSQINRAPLHSKHLLCSRRVYLN